MLESNGTIKNHIDNDTSLPEIELERFISRLKMYSKDKEMLTKTYTEILTNDNVVYILTRVSQNPIFKEQFPEFYIKNSHGESVINCQQNTIYHRYGVFKHILCAVENVGKDTIKFNEHELKILKWTMFLHDIGKPTAKVVNDSGSDSFMGHEDISAEMAANIIDRLDFTDEDKHIILTLIKYHDKYLNEGDLTYDNLSFLAQELEDKRELFQLLLEVKLADNKAKSLDVYNKFLSTQKRYYEFIGEYFNVENRLDECASNETAKEIEATEDNEDKSKKRTARKNSKPEKTVTEDDILKLYKDVSKGKNFQCCYSPIIDLKECKIYAYQIYYKLTTKDKFSYKEIIRRAKTTEIYDEVQCALCINTVSDLEKNKDLEEVIKYINIDVNSYKKNNKIIDLLSDKNIAVSFNNYETMSNYELQEITNKLRKSNVQVCLDNVQSSNKQYREIEIIRPEIIKYKLDSTESNDLKKIRELVAFCDAKSMKFIVYGIESKEEMEFAMNAGARFVEGKYFGLAKNKFDEFEKQVLELINYIQEDKLF